MIRTGYGGHVQDWVIKKLTHSLTFYTPDVCRIPLGDDYGLVVILLWSDQRRSQLLKNQICRGSPAQRLLMSALNVHLVPSQHHDF